MDSIVIDIDEDGAICILYLSAINNQTYQNTLNSLKINKNLKDIQNKQAILSSNLGYYSSLNKDVNQAINTNMCSFVSRVGTSRTTTPASTISLKKMVF